MARAVYLSKVRILDECVEREITFNVGFGVLRMSTAHSINVFGGSCSGTIGSSL